MGNDSAAKYLASMSEGERLIHDFPSYQDELINASASFLDGHFEFGRSRNGRFYVECVAVGAIPKQAGSGSKHPFATMRVGDWFLVRTEDDRVQAVSEAAAYAGTVAGQGRRFSSKRHGTLYRITRTA